MSQNDPTHWRGCAEDMRGLAANMKDTMAKRIMHRIAEDYDRLAQTAEQRVDLFPRNSKVVPANLRLFAYRRRPDSALSAEFSDLEIPSFLRRGPATRDGAGAAALPPPLPALPPPERRTGAATRAKSEKPLPQLEYRLLGPEEVQACISAIEQAMGLPPLGSQAPHEPAREVGSRAVAQALKDNPG